MGVAIRYLMKIRFKWYHSPAPDVMIWYMPYLAFALHADLAPRFYPPPPHRCPYYLSPPPVPLLQLPSIAFMQDQYWSCMKAHAQANVVWLVLVCMQCDRSKFSFLILLKNMWEPELLWWVNISGDRSYGCGGVWGGMYEYM
uniref:Uncharacterized protein n=1 Tax=Morchella importuna TaxID=1174673 RepID=A0A650AFF5_9PEZI|nr:hypothetical protein [Morchella importuna]QGN66776.1 hypothetical protein [Morchella importuna]